MHAPLDSRQLKAFVTLAKTGSYTQTARELFLTHSAISHSMRALENDAGCLLLTMVGKKVVLTETGEALLQHAQRIVGEMDQARQTLEQLKKWGYQRLRLASDPSLSEAFLHQPLVELRKKHSNLLINMELIDSVRGLEWLADKRVDLVLSEKPVRPEEVEYKPLFEDQLGLVVHRSHAWARDGRVPREKLAGHPCILTSKASSLRFAVDEYFSKEDIALNVVAEVSSLETVKELVKGGFGMGVLPWWVVRREVAEGSLVVFPPGRRFLTHGWGIHHRSGRALNAIESTFVTLCTQAAKRFASPEKGRRPRPSPDAGPSATGPV